jgi:hypothetical protein
MTLTTLVALGSVVTVLISLATLWLLWRQVTAGIRETRERPSRDALQAMTEDRNYWRDRADAYETELRRREQQ